MAEHKSKHKSSSKDKASGPPQCITMQPADQLTFQPHGNAKTTAVDLTLHNPEGTPVLFKIKTTERDFYGVKPNQGIIDAKGQVTVTITATATKKPDETKKHKFLVQTTKVDAPAGADQVQALWTAAAKESIMESKLKCVWLDDGEVVPAAAATAPQKVAVTPPAKQVQQEVATPPMSTPTRSTPAPASPVVVEAVAPPRSGHAPVATAAAAPKQTVAAAMAPVAAATTTTSSSSVGLTQRKSAAASSTSTAAAASSGVHPVTKAAATAPRPSPSTVTAAAPQQQQASIVILLLIFFLGIVFGKFVL